MKSTRDVLHVCIQVCLKQEHAWPVQTQQKTLCTPGVSALNNALLLNLMDFVQTAMQGTFLLPILLETVFNAPRLTLGLIQIARKKES